MRLSTASPPERLTRSGARRAPQPGPVRTALLRPAPRRAFWFCTARLRPSSVGKATAVSGVAEAGVRSAVPAAHGKEAGV